MKTSNKFHLLFTTGLLASLLIAGPLTVQAKTCDHPHHAANTQSTITDDEARNLLSHYQVFDEELATVKNITIQFYDEELELVYSDTVCPQEYDCDERINQLINQSDFITEVDGTMIFILNQ